MNFERDKAPTFITLDDAVAVYKSRPQKSAAEYMAEISKIAQHYGAQILQEPDLYQHFTGVHVDARNYPADPIITEEAVVVSIVTVKKL